MAENVITCPKCGARIPLTEAFTHDIEESLKRKYQAELKSKSDQMEAAFRTREKETVERLAAERAALESQAKKRAEENVKVELQDLKNQLGDNKKQLEASRQTELDLRKRQHALEDRERQLELEVERTLAAERSKIRADAETKAAEDHRLREMEKDKQLADMRKQIEDLKRKAELTSQQIQGEVQELELEVLLTKEFRADVIEPVPKGVKGADVLQRVRDERGIECGTIIWESKRTKTWSDGWIQKLKDDRSLVKAELAVLVTSALPKEIRSFGAREGIWVTDFPSAIGLATALRENLIQLAYLRNSLTGRNDKKDLMYDYLAGPQFKQRIETVLESFKSMREDLEAEKRAIEKGWAKREMQLSRVLRSTAGLYGDLQGIIGSALPDVKMLELPGNALPPADDGAATR